jgi:sugar phosphate isomerase/epimerase
MELGIFAKTFEGKDPVPVMSAAKAAGFSTVQYNMACSGLASMPDVISETQAVAVSQAAQKSVVSVAAVSGTYNMIHPDVAVRDKGLARLQVLASRAHAMGTRVITLCTGTRDAEDQWRHHPDNTSRQAWKDLLAAMQSALAIAETHDVELAIEPELANVVSSAAKARELIAELRSSRLRVVLDAANLFEQASTEEQRRIVSSAVDSLADRIVMAHAKDRSADGGFVAAGRGVLDYGHYLSCLKRVGFDGPLVTHGLSAEEALGVSAFLRSALGKVA